MVATLSMVTTTLTTGPSHLRFMRPNFLAR